MGSWADDLFLKGASTCAQCCSKAYKIILEGCTHLSMVMWHGREQVVADMGVSNVVEHNVQKTVRAVDSGQSSPQPFPLLVIIVR